MTAKEKAKELVDKIYLELMDNYCRCTQFEGETDFEDTYDTAKDIATICVNEIDTAIDFDYMEIQNLDRQHNWWNQVIEEIKLLKK